MGTKPQLQITKPTVKCNQVVLNTNDSNSVTKHQYFYTLKIIKGWRTM